jgi:hypothetical protein
MEPVLEQLSAILCELQTVSAQRADGIFGHSFMAGCADSPTTIDRQRAFLMQHGTYARYSTRVPCGLISQVDETNDLLRLGENPTEELGFRAGAVSSRLRFFDALMEGAQ